MIITFKNSDYNKANVYLTNFLNNTAQTGSFHTFNIENNDYKIEFNGIDDYKYYQHKLYEDTLDVAVTSIAEIDLKNHEIDLIENIEKLTFLSSYCHKTQISPISFNFFSGETLCKTILLPIRTTKFSNKDKLIEPINLKDFIEKCFPTFRKI